MKIITRFAPSPTGFLHIGGARTALFNYLFAKNKQGEFLLRIEDTDQKRSTEPAIKAIIEGLNWLGIIHNGKVVFQSQNKKRHQQIAINLLEKDKAYHCYVSAEELEEMRQNAAKKGEVFRFKSPWRDKFLSQTSSVRPVIRIKAPLIGQTIIKDLIQGEIKVNNDELDDLVLLRNDGSPTYMLAVVADDHDMNITHIIRGSDHLTNSFRQKIIYDALNWHVPEFAHIPLIFGTDGTKMSKRHGATSVIDYKEIGYLPEAMRNYLLRLGWSHGDEEIISDENAIKWFNLEKIGKSPAKFDFAKLDSLNQYYLKQKNEEDLFDLIEAKFYRETEQDEKIRIIKALKFLKERAIKLYDLVSSSEIYLNDFNKKVSDQDLALLQERKELIKDFREMISKIDDWNQQQIKSVTDNYLTTKNLKIKDLAPVLRIALTFSSSSAGGILEIIEILGKKEILRRLLIKHKMN